MNDLEFQKTDAGRELAIIAIVFGLAAFFLVLLPVVGIWALIPSVLAIVFAGIGLIQAGKSNGKKQLLLSAAFIGLISSVFIVLYLFVFTKKENTPPKPKEKIEIAPENDSLMIDTISKKELEKVLEEFEDEVRTETNDSINQ